MTQIIRTPPNQPNQNSVCRMAYSFVTGSGLRSYCVARLRSPREAAYDGDPGSRPTGGEIAERSRQDTVLDKEIMS